MQIEISKRFWEDKKWAHENYTKLQEKYTNKWVAVYNKKVVAVADGPEDARKEAQIKTGARDIAVIFVESGQNLYKN